MNNYQEGLHPRRSAELGQSYLDLCRRKIDAAIGIWQLRIDLEAGNQETYQKTARTAVEALNKVWPFTGEPMQVSGHWYRPQLPLPNYPHFRVDKDEVLEIATSHGLGSIWMDGELKIGYTFELGKHFFNNSMFKGQIETFAFALPNGISLDYIGSPDLDSIDLPDRINEAIRFYNQYWWLHIEKSNFFSISHERQRRFVDGFIDHANDIIGWPESSAYVSVSTAKSYVRTSLDSPYGFASIVPDEGSERLEIEGSIAGAALLEQAILDTKPLRGREDFIDPDAGLCLIVTPNATSNINNGINGHGILVPMASIDAITIDNP